MLEQLLKQSHRGINPSLYGLEKQLKTPVTLYDTILQLVNFLLWSLVMNEMLENGVELMLIGMGIVFLFLTLLVVAIKVMSSLITRFFPEPIAVPPPIPSLVAKKKPIDSGVIAAISAAVHHYKKQHSQQ